MKDNSFSIQEEQSSAQSDLRFQLKNTDFASEKEQASEFSAELWTLAHTDKQEQSTKKYYTYSLVLHTLLAVSTLALATQNLNEPKTETITVELSDSTPAGLMPAEDLGVKTESAEITKSSAALPLAAAPAPVAATQDQEVIVKASKVLPQQAPKTVSQKTAPVHPQAVAAAKPTFVPPSIPSNIEELGDTEVLDEKAFEEKPTTQPVLTAQDLDEKFSAVDEKNKNLEKALLAQAEAQEQQIQNDQLAQLEALDQQQQQEAERLAAYQQGLKERNAQALAAAQADAQRNAAARAAAIAAAQKQAQQNVGGGSGGGQGKTTAGEGQGQGIRSLDQIRQMPGNPRPQYSEVERLNQQQGSVVFLAYISRSGQPVEFRQLQSTGYANLDQKTLDALKQWKFYPGQEGWVEIPFKWDLRGGPQETSALSKRKVSQR